MSFYEPQSWQAPARQSSWEQPPPPSRSGASSSSQRDDGVAFATQFEEVDRAVDNLVKSGKFYTPGPRHASMGPMMGPGRQYMDQGSRMHGPRHSVGQFDPSRSPSGPNRQNYYASQRYQGRHGEPESMFHAKRRMAQQRERELRNYHQEQQYNRSVLAEMASNKSDRSHSPSTLSEEGRRELIARQHRALYGSETANFIPQGAFDEAANTKGPIGGGPRGPSPRAGDPFGGLGQGAPGLESSVQVSQESGRPEKTTSPAGAPGFGTFEGAGQSSGKVPTPPTGDDSSHARHLSKSTTAPLSGGMAPIGSRPNPQHSASQSLNKRTTSPLPASTPFGFGSSEQTNERSTSSNSNSKKEGGGSSGIGAWGTGSGVWGSNKIGATSVWG